MNKCRSRSVLVATVTAFSILAYLAPLSHSPSRTDRDIREDDSNVDVNGVMLDFLEMSVELDAQSQVPNSAPNQQSAAGRKVDQATLPLIKLTTSHPQAVNRSDQESLKSWPGTSQPENKDEGLQLSAEMFNNNISEGASNDSHPHLTPDNGTKLANSLNPFSVHNDSLTLPVPFATLPTKELLQQDWVNELKHILLQIPRGPVAPVSIVSADYKFREVLINWLIAAKTQANPPLTHVVVFSLHRPLCELLKQRNICCIFVSPKVFLTENTISHLTKHAVFSEVMVLRLTAMRLMNYWGYDVANYDTDAIVLKSPESLFLAHSDSHMIGSYGHYPGVLSKVWGTTVCCGLLVTKSSPYTEVFWNAVSTALPRSLNDQARLNYAISSLQPDWGNTKNKSIMRDKWTAATPSGFKVTVLPAKYICRQGCSKKDRSYYYVWHKGGQSSDGKMRYAQRGNLWYLRSDWEARTNNSLATGEEWLREITEQS